MFRFLIYFFSIFGVLHHLFGWENNLESLEANFLQTTYQDNEKITYSGILYAKSPSLARWIYTTPLKKEIYLNDKEVIIYEPILEQATFTNLAKQADFFAILHSAKLGADGKYHTTISDINYTLTLKNNNPYKITFTDTLSNTIEIILTNLKINPILDSNLFIFKPKGNIDIIKQ